MSGDTEHGVIEKEAGNKVKEEFKPGVPVRVYTDSKFPPGSAPEGYRWKVHSRNPDKRDRIEEWILVSAEPEMPTMDQLPPINPRKGKPINDFMEPLPGFEDNGSNIKPS